MKHLMTCAVALALSIGPLWAETDKPEDSDGPSLMERGAEMLLEGLRQELDPALKDLQALTDQLGPAVSAWMEEMGPALADLMGQIDDLSQYKAPEVLPNGDIIIRRKESAPKAERPLKPGETEI